MSYNIYIVEDEYMLREYIKTSPIWTNSPYTLCGDSSNGEDAWEEIRSLPVDILLTDIKMPFMDGLTLSRMIREHRPEIKIIILSGYDDFSYAKQALALGVTDYLLKPLKPEDLLTALNRTAQALDKERRQLQAIKALQEIANESLELSYQKFLSQLCRGLLPEQRIISESQRLHIPINAAYYTGCILAIHELRRAETDEDAYLSFLDCSQVIRLFSKEHSNCFWYTERSEEFCLVITGNSREHVLDTAHSYLSTLLLSLADTLQLTHTIAVIGSPTESIHELHLSMTSANIVYAMLHTSESTQTVFLADNYSHAFSSMQYSSVEKQLFRSLLISGTRDDVPRVVEILIKNLQNAPRSQLYLSYIYLDILTSFSDFIKELGPSHTMIPEVNIHNIAQMFCFNQDLAKFKNALSNLATQAIVYRESCSDKRNDSIVKEARDYIVGHFSNPNLDLGAVAKHVSITPSYLSTLFRQETGQCFIDFLTSLRISRAKELLQTTQMRTCDIAFEVGYTDQNYFSKLFKKRTGVSTREFRQSKFDTQQKSPPR